MLTKSVLAHQIITHPFITLATMMLHSYYTFFTTMENHSPVNTTKCVLGTFDKNWWSHARRMARDAHDAEALIDTTLSGNASLCR
ncbi:hypothetical protein B0J12DRAFT_785930 [Macrophomina phaseolina]|uniref:Uncharacterized protein n=1 Tax=Macrophomina phaseolina TaxID=35725 RepID=A0ABQ8G9H2_9PEZI|nr:hypothetical protein B0J12DRAFT_785930 [Macrophomina phaseolina]